MNKKTIFIIFSLLVLFGTFFYWKNQQKELIDINNSLPEGIKAEKTLFGDYKIINKIDNYSFQAPKEWAGFRYIEYAPEEKIKNYIASTIELEGEVEHSRYIMINKFQNSPNANTTIEEKATNIFTNIGIQNNFEKNHVRDRIVAITRENPDLMGMDVYFFQTDSKIYSVMGNSSKFIEEIIANGEWQ